MALASLGRLGQLESWDNLGSGLGQSANPSIPIGYPWHWHPWVDWDPGQCSPLKADWDSVGQCGMDWDNAYPLDLHGIGILGRLGQRGILGQSSILDNLQGRLAQCGLGQDWDNGYPLDIHGIGIPG